MYYGYDEEKKQSKRSTKGVPHDHELKLQEFLDCLNETVTTSNTCKVRMLRSTNDNIVKRISIEKKVLSNIFVKLRVMSDGVTCKPLTLDGKIL